MCWRFVSSSTRLKSLMARKAHRTRRSWEKKASASVTVLETVADTESEESHSREMLSESDTDLEESRIRENLPESDADSEESRNREKLSASALRLKEPERFCD